MFVCECEGKVNPLSETFQLQPGLFIAVTVYVVCSLLFLFFVFSIFAELSRYQHTFVSTYPSPPYTDTHTHTHTHTHTYIQTHKCTSICCAVSLSLVPGSTSAYQMHPRILCHLSCLFSVLSLDDRLSHLGGVCARAAWMFGSVLKRGEVMWLILISFQLSASSASSSLRLSFAVSVSLSTPVTATPRRQTNHEDADRIFLGHFFFFFFFLLTHERYCFC